MGEIQKRHSKPKSNSNEGISYTLDEKKDCDLRKPEGSTPMNGPAINSQLVEAYKKALELVKSQVKKLNGSAKSHRGVTVEFDGGFSETMLDRTHLVAVECEAQITVSGGKLYSGVKLYKVQINLDDPKKSDYGPADPHVGYTVREVGENGMPAGGNKDNRPISGHALINRPPKALGVTLPSRSKDNTSGSLPPEVKLRTEKDTEEEREAQEKIRQRIRPESSHWKDMFSALNEIIKEEKEKAPPASDLSGSVAKSCMKTSQSSRGRG